MFPRKSMNENRWYMFLRDRKKVFELCAPRLNSPDSQEPIAPNYFNNKPEKACSQSKNGLAKSIPKSLANSTSEGA